MQRFLIAFIFFIALISSLPLNAVEEENLLANGSFEKIDKSLPVGWSCKGGEWSRDSQNHGSGNYSLLLRLAEKNASTVLSQDLKLPQHAPMVLRLRARSEATVSGVKVCMIQKKAPYEPVLGRVFSCRGWEWKNIELYFYSPAAETEEVVLRLIPIGYGKLWIDDIFLGRNESTSRENSPEISFAPQLLQNGNFELVRPYAIPGWTFFKRETGGYQFSPEVYREGMEQCSENDDVANGEKCLKIVHASPHAVSEYISLPILNGIARPENLELSLFAKTVKGNSQLEFGLRSGPVNSEKTVTSQKVELTAEWQKYTLTAELERQSEVYIKYAKAGTILVDACRVCRAGENRTAPDGGLEYFLDTEDDFGISTTGTPTTLHVLLLNPAGKMSEIKYSLLISDYLDRPIGRFDRQINLEGKPVESSTVNLPELPTGYYLARLITEGQEKRAEVKREMSFAVINPQHNTDGKRSRFGLHIRYADGYLKLAARLGTGFIRDHDLGLTKWSIVEPKQGRFSSTLDLVKNIKDRNGLEFLGSLDYTPEWASSARKDSFAIKSAPRSDKAFWYYAKMYPPRDINDMVNYTRRMVSEYGNKISFWETWNEVEILDSPEDRHDKKIRHGFMKFTLPEYIDSAKKIYTAVKETNRNAVVVGQLTCHEPYTQLDKLIEAGATESVDAIAIHFYQGMAAGIPPDEADRDNPPLKELVAKWRKAMKEKGKVVPLWDSEFGLFSTASNYTLDWTIKHEGVDNLIAAEYVAKSCLVKTALGFEKIFYYSMFQPKLHSLYNPFFEYDGKPRPALAAYSFATSQLNGAEFTGLDLENSRLHAVAFRKASGNHTEENTNETIFCLWQKRFVSDRDIKIPKLNISSKAKAFSMMGTPLTEKRLSIGTSPVYITAEGKTAELIYERIKQLF